MVIGYPQWVLVKLKSPVEEKMRYIKPHYYENFRCLAGKCPDTCCAGWEIVIDEESLEAYANAEGPFGSRLKNSIDWEEGCFCQYQGRCSFLNEEELCDLYQELGEDALCETCRMYPRHVEEFDGLRELSLSLSCPEAARMILECREPVRFLEEETEEEDEDFGDMDLLLFTQLEDARTVIFRILQDRRISFDIRKAATVDMAKEIQMCIDNEEYFKVDDIIKKYKKKDISFFLEQREEKKDFMQKCREFPVFLRMETLRKEWGWFLQRAWEELYAKGEAAYRGLEEEFCKACTGYDSNMKYDCDPGCGEEGEGQKEPCSPENEGETVTKASWECMAEQLMMFFMYTYFCGAVYDDCIYSKAALSAFSVEWIQEFCMLRWLENGKRLTVKDVEEIAWRYAREVEHSDLNLEILEGWVDEMRGAETGKN